MKEYPTLNENGEVPRSMEARPNAIDPVAILAARAGNRRAEYFAESEEPSQKSDRDSSRVIRLRQAADQSEAAMKKALTGLMDRLLNDRKIGSDEANLIITKTRQHYESIYRSAGELYSSEKNRLA